MIHGVAEGEPEGEYDKECISSFLKVFGTDVNPESFTRLGKLNEESSVTKDKKKSRPLRI